ncbi:unnamed protein product [Kuraishia capsulata CBS 1993]|uniref:Uncharacterized protein n=1 Tax=Kuraishia capsulata CBS 1993 TaxID=1382522 RepID=W6MN95_9ASCO|nr:uncharacterized protein KUCA_T00004057001 [Kuraishia capsulata CBS 1993]CDK28076.1 unnamed protein product [Kuraishia capsulata CBS 1993]
MFRPAFNTFRQSYRRYASITTDSHKNAIELYYKINKNPKLYEAMMKTSTLLLSKGFASNPVDLSLNQKLRLLNDTEIQDTLREFKQLLSDEKINIDLKVIGDFFQFFGDDIVYEIK